MRKSWGSDRWAEHSAGKTTPRSLTLKTQLSSRKLFLIGIVILILVVGVLIYRTLATAPDES